MVHHVRRISLTAVVTLALSGVFAASAAAAAGDEVPVGGDTHHVTATPDDNVNMLSWSSNDRPRFEALESRLAGLGLSVAPLPLARYKSDDPRWGLTQIGVATMDWTACVPAAFASLLSAHGIHRNPVHVAEIMHKSGDYNREVAGAGGYSIVQAAKQFDLTATPLRSEDALTDALRKNHAVIALLAGPDTLALPETTHAVALSGLNNGHTFAVNPGVFDDAWFAVSELWENRSTLDLDEHQGAVFWVIR